VEKDIGRAIPMLHGEVWFERLDEDERHVSG
jgi:hypothetical protein